MPTVLHNDHKNNNCVNRDYWRLLEITTLNTSHTQHVCVVHMPTVLHNDHKNNNCVNRDYWRLLEITRAEHMYFTSSLDHIHSSYHMPTVLHNDHKNNTPCTVLTRQQVVTSYVVLHETMWISKGIMGPFQLFTYEMDALDTQTVMATT